MKTFSTWVALFALCLWSTNAAWADEGMMTLMQDQIKQMQATMIRMQSTIQTQNETIEKLNLRIEGLDSSREIRTTPAVSETRTPALGGLSQGFNPEIGVAGTVQAQLTESTEDAEGKDTIALKELEMSISQVVDPYSRLDAIITFNDNLEEQNVDIEEAYYTHWGLPLGFQGQIGKFRSKIGKQNMLHLHQLSTADYPEIIKDLFGEEGLASSGVRLQNWMPNPWDIPVELTGEVLRGNNGNLFAAKSRRPIFNGHVKAFFEPTDDTQVELGGTFMSGDQNLNGRDEGDDRYDVHVWGGDATFTWFLPEERKFVLQNELYAVARAQSVTANHDPWGFYTLAELTLSKKWRTGVRFDFVEPRATADEHHETFGISPFLRFYQSEFADFGIQYTHKEPAAGDEEIDNAVFLYANFLIGAHKHPVQ